VQGHRSCPPGHLPRKKLPSVHCRLSCSRRGRGIIRRFGAGYGPFVLSFLYSPGFVLRKSFVCTFCLDFCSMLLICFLYSLVLILVCLFVYTVCFEISSLHFLKTPHASSTVSTLKLCDLMPLFRIVSLAFIHLYKIPLISVSCKAMYYLRYSNMHKPPAMPFISAK
jgi:hypothetical protein